MTTGPVFLCGDEPGTVAAAEAFVAAAGGAGSTIALLLQGGPNWQKYVPRYAEPWAKFGATCTVIVPDTAGNLDVEHTTAAINGADAIFIGGGHTPTYRRLYAAPPIRDAIRAAHARGVPVGGVSAGALILPEVCITSHTGAGDPTWQGPGIGLLANLLVGVHFSEWQGEAGLVTMQRATGIRTAWGIDGSACAVFEDGQFSQVWATTGAVYELTLHPERVPDYTVERHMGQNHAALGAAGLTTCP